MNTHSLLPLTAAILFSVCAGSMLISTQSTNAATASTQASADSHIVDLPTVTVRPEASDLAYFQANKVVDLAAVTVRPEASDLAYFQANKVVDLAAVTVHPEASDLAFFLADNTARIVDMPVMTVRPSVADIQVVAVGVATLARQLASR
ncbi:MAG TPA: hypothetical protein VIT22_13035 [Pseudoxanthomonas sp.]